MQTQLTPLQQQFKRQGLVGTPKLLQNGKEKGSLGGNSIRKVLEPLTSQVMDNLMPSPIDAALYLCSNTPRSR